MAKRFAGQVKASDIREEFERFSTYINEMIDKYNSLIDTQDHDYTKGNSSLGAYGYSLSVGGLKLLLNKANDYVVGCKVFKISESKGITTPGIYINNDGGHYIPSQEIDIGDDNVVLWYNPVTKLMYTNGGQNPGAPWKPIRELNPRREVTALINTRRNLQLEDTDGLTISTPNVSFDNNFRGTPYTTGNSSVFISANEGIHDWRDRPPYNFFITRMFGTEVQANADEGPCKWWMGMNYFYLPKRVQNPYTYVGTYMKQVVAGVIRET